LACFWPLFRPLFGPLFRPFCPQGLKENEGPNEVAILMVLGPSAPNPAGGPGPQKEVFFGVGFGWFLGSFLACFLPFSGPSGPSLPGWLARGFLVLGPFGPQKGPNGAPKWGLFGPILALFLVNPAPLGPDFGLAPWRVPAFPCPPGPKGPNCPGPQKGLYLPVLGPVLACFRPVLAAFPGFGAFGALPGPLLSGPAPPGPKPAYQRPWASGFSRFGPFRALWALKGPKGPFFGPFGAPNPYSSPFPRFAPFGGGFRCFRPFFGPFRPFGPGPAPGCFPGSGFLGGFGAPKRPFSAETGRKGAINSVVRGLFSAFLWGPSLLGPKRGRIRRVPGPPGPERRFSGLLGSGLGALSLPRLPFSGLWPESAPRTLKEAKKGQKGPKPASHAPVCTLVPCLKPLFGRKPD